MKKRIFWTIFLVAIIGAGAALAYIFRDDIKGFLQPHKHVYELTEEIPATCTEDGKKVYTCGDCGETTEETIPATGHTEEILPGTAATCIDKGFTDTVRCSVCKHILAMPEIIPALGHNLDLIIPGHEATCTEPGLTDGKECSRCGSRPILQVEIPATGHDFIDETCVNCGVATVSSLWTLPASAGYTVDGNELTFAGTNELTFSTKQQYSSVTLTFSVSETQDVRGAFQVGWGAQTTDASINDLPFVQFNYDRAVLVLPDGTTYDTSWLTGKSWKLTIDAENNKVILSVDGEVVYNVDTSWWTQEGWGLPGHLILRAESNCALTLLTQINPTV